jgi:hypothetical protein
MIQTHPLYTPSFSLSFVPTPLLMVPIPGKDLFFLPAFHFLELSVFW